jgi:hypothetical protein
MTGPADLARAVALAGRARTRVLAALSLLREGLGISGWGGLLAISLGVAAFASASALEHEAEALQAAAARARDDSRRAALERTQSQAGRAEPVRPSADPLALPADPPSATVLPAAFFALAERSGIRLGPVEYRTVRQSAAVRRVDVALTVNGRYLATRRWLSEAMVALPHAQLLELTMQRADPNEVELEIRVVLAVHFGGRT